MTQDLAAKLGKPVSDFAFGVMQFGGKADDRASRTMFDQARDAGITIFDAAYIYTDGKAEELLGHMAQSDRAELILTSKCVYRPEAAGRACIDQVHTSLERLRTDHVDILYMHRDPGERLDDTLETLAELHSQGTFRLLGASNLSAWRVMHAQARAREIGAPRIEVLQPMYNLVKRQAEVELLPMAQAEALTVHAYSPLGGGLLTGKYADHAAGHTSQGRLAHDKAYAARYGQNWMHGTATALKALAAEHGHAPEALAVAWAAAHPGVSAPILSASHPDQLPASLAAAGIDMTPELRGQLSALSRTPAPATDRLEEA